VIVTLRAQRAGSYKLRVLLFPDASLQKENRMAEVLKEAAVRVREAGVCSARSFLASFWPPQGAVAGVPAGFAIQACSPFAFFCAYTSRKSKSDGDNITMDAFIPESGGWTFARSVAFKVCIRPVVNWDQASMQECAAAIACVAGLRL
jgi:hypothetical protein